MQRTTKITTALLGAMVLLAAPLCTALCARAAGPGEPHLRRTVILADLENPWDLAVAPDGALFFTEKCRGLSVRTPDGAIRHLFGTSGAAVVADDLFCQGQSGMLGLALDPAFADNRRLYLFMASKLDGQPANRVVRLRGGRGHRHRARPRTSSPTSPSRHRSPAGAGPGPTAAADCASARRTASS